MNKLCKVAVPAFLVGLGLAACGKGGSVEGKGPPTKTIEEALGQCEIDVPKAVGPSMKYDNEDKFLDAWDLSFTKCMRFHRYECVRASNGPCTWTPLS